MKTLTCTLLAVFFLLFFPSLKAQDPTFEWVHQIGGVDWELARDITTDNDGNVYTTGYFKGTVDFDPGEGVYELTNPHIFFDNFIQKLDGNGELVWAIRIGGEGADFGENMTVDDFGNIYLTGKFSGTSDFDPSDDNFFLTADSGDDAFILKLDSNADFVWATNMGSMYSNWARAITTDNNGNLLTAGSFSATTDFDPGVGIVNLTSESGKNGFIQKLDVNGDLLWARGLGGPGQTRIFSIDTDENGNIYTTGHFWGTADFDPSVGVYNLTSVGDWSIFISKIDSDGNFVWANQIGSIWTDWGNSIATDASGNVYTTGRFAEAADFDPGPETFTMSAGGSPDIFVQKLSNDGNFIWAKQIGGEASANAASIVVDLYGNAYISGVFGGTADFDPGANVHDLTSEEYVDAYIEKIDADGEFVWVKQITGPLLNNHRPLAVDDDGNLYSAGPIQGEVNFDPGTTNQILQTVGGLDTYVLKVGQCQSSTTQDLVESCDPYTWIDGETYAENNNTATHILSNAAGCDSIIQLDLTINSSFTIEEVTACDSYTWINGETYTLDNDSATQVFTGSTGCDSIIQLDLTINSSYSTTDQLTACDEYTWINGETYTSSIADSFILSTTAGCDSIFNLDLIINSVTDLTTTTIGSTISSNNLLGTYQWVDCTTDYTPIVGETDIDFTATENGNYAVLITENGCQDVSDCITLTAVGIDEIGSGSQITVYPNPFDGRLYIEMDNTQESITIRVLSMTGQEILNQVFSNTNIAALELDLSEGIYLLELRDASGNVSTETVIKE